MNAAASYLRELEAALHVRGPGRRRFLVECRDHLADASEAYGPDEAVRRFGPIAEVVRGIEVEVAVRRARVATLLVAAAVVAVAASTVMMLDATDASRSAPVAWAVVFFGSAQTAAAATFLALLRAAAMRAEEGTPAELALLCRRNGVALVFSALTMFAVGAAVPGDTAAWRILLGPLSAVVAGMALVRAYAPARRHRGDEERVVHPPLADLMSAARLSPIVGTPAWSTRPGAVLAPALFVCTIAAAWWGYHDDHGTAADAAAAAGIEAACLLAGFALLGPILGLFARSRSTTE